MSQSFGNINSSFNNNNSFYNNSCNIINCAAPDDESKILAWLSPLEPWVRHRDIVAQRVDSVGSWILETREFKRWRNGNREAESNHATLFCDGNPGVGKSYIISLVIDKLCDGAEEDDAAVVCFYFDFAARSEQSPINVLGSLLRQIVSGLDEIPEVVVRAFRKQKKVIGGRGLQVSGILEMFQTITATRRTFICVDALDECVPEHRMVVLKSLGQILQESPNTRIFMTGRSHVRGDVEWKLGGTASFIFTRPTEDGLIRYLREKLRNDTSRGIMSARLEANILKIIPEISSETFLLASLHIEAILRETTIARRGKRLKLVKDGAGLGGAYGATMERIMAQDEEKTKLAIATLTWICYSERPLLVDELCHALGVEIGATDFDLENVPLIDTLLDCCQGLITVDKEASVARLIHFTVQEYLCNHSGLLVEPHLIIADTCLTYLNSRRVRELSTRHLPEHSSMPFLRYSSRYWGTHANRDLSDRGRALAHELFYKYEDHISAVSLLQQVLHPKLPGGGGTSPFFSGLHCASFFGIVELVAALVGAGSCEINQPDCTASTPLSWAARNGHEEVVRILLEQQDADPNRPDEKGRTPLGCAAIEGHQGVVKLLLEREDVDPNLSDKYCETPLAWAAINGREGVAKLLLDRENVDPNLPNVDRRSPLACAAVEGHDGVVKLLLERKDVDPNHLGKYDRTPLVSASVNGHEGVVKLLLERKDVDPNRPDRFCGTPLTWAAINGYEGVVKQLLGRGDVDPNIQIKHPETPLWWAATNSHEGVVRLLLEREDVDANRTDKNGGTPLRCAAMMGHEGVVKLLLERGDVRPNHPDENGRTPLGCAATKGHEGVVKLLLQREDVDPNYPDENGRTPLGCAAIEGHEGVVKLLLGREDVDPNRLGVNN